MQFKENCRKLKGGIESIVNMASKLLHLKNVVGSAHYRGTVNHLILCKVVAAMSQQI